MRVAYGLNGVGDHVAPGRVCCLCCDGEGHIGTIEFLGKGLQEEFGSYDTRSEMVAMSHNIIQ